MQIGGTLVFLVLASLCAILVSGCSDNVTSETMKPVDVTMGIASPIAVNPSDPILADTTIPQPGANAAGVVVMPPLDINVGGYGLGAVSDVSGAAPAFQLAAIQGVNTINADKPLALTFVDGNLSTTKAVLPSGVNELSLATGTSLTFTPDALTTGAMTRVSAQPLLRFTTFKIYFDVLPSGKWTLPTKAVLHLNQTPDNKFILKDSGMTLTWSGSTSIPPIDNIVTLDIKLYDGASLVFTGSKNITVRNGSANLTAMSRVPFTSAKIQLDLRNSKTPKLTW